jgi:hypothetical protein
MKINETHEVTRVINCQITYVVKKLTDDGVEYYENLDQDKVAELIKDRLNADNVVINSAKVFVK